MCSLRPSFSCLRHCTVAAQYPSFSTLHSFRRPLSTDERYHPGWKTARLPSGASTHSISVSPIIRHPRESQPISTTTKGKAKDLSYDEEDGDKGGSSGRRKVGRGKFKGDKINSLGRLLTRILRHNAVKLRLNIRPDGYVPLDQLLKLREKSFAGIPLCSHTIDDVHEAVKNDNKQRLSLLEENGQLYIRANQGHTVNVVESDELSTPISSAEEVPVCVHGTYRKNLESIFKSGLSRMKRLQVHFATGLPHDGDVISGMRANVEILIFLNVEMALKDGMKLYLSANKVILTEGFDGVVPPKYFAKVETWPKREPIPLS
ncbi:hypothetical protein SUGI_0207200 [Cryptomeria japonica]|uniref:uncharacterized protein LOC131032641 isoform X2 n=1 Tax=Cryptomeria japonica TaxID=3369 RepID=UPI002408AB71|nr:uncharacterized protein LOC131032641 isoform X2 [Cryptomeria japonica]GLJ13193.1 hypothetical protein SUGI_0207200 [Cryptomeria japonica]